MMLTTATKAQNRRKGQHGHVIVDRCLGHDKATETAAGRCSCGRTHSEEGQAQPAFLSDELMVHADANLTFAFGHHPIGDFKVGEEEFWSLLTDFGVSVYAHGHKHSHAESFDNGVYHFTHDSLAYRKSVAVWAVDNDNVAVGVASHEEWPVIVITAPADASLGGGNPYATVVPPAIAENPVRALTFTHGAITAVRFQIDSGSWVDMGEVSPHLWQGVFDSNGLELGAHGLVVEAASSEARSQESTFLVGVTDATCGGGEIVCDDQNPCTAATCNAGSVCVHDGTGSRSSATTATPARRERLVRATRPGPAVAVTSSCATTRTPARPTRVIPRSVVCTTARGSRSSATTVTPAPRARSGG